MQQAPDYENVARLCNAYGRHADTFAVCAAGLARDPGNAMLHVYRACAHDEFGRSAEAIADLEAALRLAPRGPVAIQALITLALVREREGDRDAAFAAIGRALALDPADREAHAAFGTLLARHGAYPRAWAELEFHHLDERVRYHKRFPDLREWNGEPIAAQRLLVVHGQGLGDLLQLARYLPRLRERCARLLLECAEPLVPLLRASAVADGVAVSGTTARADFDAFARATALPRIFAEDARAFTGVPYLRAPHAARDAWRARLGPRDGRRRIGLAWAGNPAHPNDRRRSIPLDAFAPFAELADVRWISLQVGPRAADAPPAGLALERYDEHIHDMSDTAALLGELDLAVCADTSPAHLAGALNLPVHLLLPWRPDWRWQPEAERTPWYPSLRLWHAHEPSWGPAIAALTAALREEGRASA